MGKAQIVINEYFVIERDDFGNEYEAIYKPPLLAEYGNIRVELRKEKNHSSPHIHLIKMGSSGLIDVSVALDDLKILAGEKNLKYFNEREFKKVAEFIVQNRDRFIKIYQHLKGDL